MPRPIARSQPVPRLAAALLALALAAASAAAEVRYVAPDGVAANTGLSPESPWPLARANAELRAGDLCRMAPGMYLTPIDPAGTGTGAGRRITYLGDPSRPAAVTVPAIRIARAWVTVTGVRADGGITLAFGSWGDSVYRCVSLGGLAFEAAKHCVVARCSVDGPVAFLANEGRPCYSGQRLDRACVANSESDTLRRNVLRLGTIRPGDRRFEFKAWTQGCVIDSNRVTGTFDDGPGTPADGGIALVSYNSYRQTFRDNRWEFEAARNHHDWPNTTWDAFYLRDSLHTTTFERDTVLAGLHSPDGVNIRCMMSASGSFPGGVRNVTMRDCVLRVRGDILWQGGFEGWTLDGCVLQSRDGIPLLILSDWVSSRIRRCTVWSRAEALRMDGPGGGNHVKGKGNEVVSNIFYTTNAGTLGNEGGVAMWKDNTSGVRSDGNLYFAPQSVRVPGDLSLVWSGYFSSRPGAGQPWHRMNGQDAHSRHGSPRFADSTWAGFDPRLRPGSAALGLAEDGGDAGAKGRRGRPAAAHRR